MDQCPACGAETTRKDGVCAECGMRLEGPTASFEALVEPTEPLEIIEVDVAEVPVLVLRKGIEAGERFYLEQPRMTIGRDPSSSIFLNDVTVSRHHAVLYVEGDGVRIEDAGSLNGTYVNDAVVAEAELSSGDAVQIGRFQMVFVSGVVA
ncbi:MAG: FHA domain-containing protein [Coriobacteriia bacterium]